MATTEQQLQRFFEILSSSKLPSELSEALSLSISHFATVQSGTNDAQKVSIPLLRGDKGSYDAATNTPALADGTGVGGDSYLVTVGGTRDFGGGNIQLFPDDIIEYRSGQWKKVTGAGKGQISFHTDKADFPTTGSINTFYTDLTAAEIYLWDSGVSDYVLINELTSAKISAALGFSPVSPTDLNAKVEDQIVDGVVDKAPSQNVVFDEFGKVVYGIRKSDGTLIPKDGNNEVTLPEIVSDVHVVAVDTIWNTGQSQTFTASDSAKVTNVSVNGSELRETIEWSRPTATTIEILVTLNDGDWVKIEASATSASISEVISFALSSPSADLATGDTDSFHAPYNFTLRGYFAGVVEAPTGSALVVGLKKNNTSVTSSDAIIDADETTSLTGTAPVLTETSFLKGDLITPSIVQVGSLTTGKSLKIYLAITKS